jgi:hypothetical protein
VAQISVMAEPVVAHVAEFRERVHPFVAFDLANGSLFAGASVEVAAAYAVLLSHPSGYWRGVRLLCLFSHYLLHIV